MKKLKTELLMLGRDRGDTGSSEEQRRMIDTFFVALQTYLTPEGIDTFSVEELRTAYVEFARLVMEKPNAQEVVQSLPLLIHLRTPLRNKSPQTTVSSDSVVDIFSRRS